MQIKVVDNRTSLSRKLKELSEQVEGLSEEVGRQTIQSLVAESPVDTGAFMDSYNATDGRSRGGGVSSEGRQRRQSWETYAAAAIITGTAWTPTATCSIKQSIRCLAKRTDTRSGRDKRNETS